MPRLTRTYPRCPACKVGPMVYRDGCETLSPAGPLEDLYGRLYGCPLCGGRYYEVSRLVSAEPEEAEWLRGGDLHTRNKLLEIFNGKE